MGDDIYYDNDLLKMLSEALDELEEKKSKMATSTAASSATIAIPGIPDSSVMYDSAATVPSEDVLIKLASKNMLQSHTNMSMDEIQATGEQYKTQIKIRMMDTMRQEIMNKTKFTMIQDKANYRMNFKAQVYVFTEEELKKFIKDVINS